MCLGLDEFGACVAFVSAVKSNSILSISRDSIQTLLQFNSRRFASPLMLKNKALPDTNSLRVTIDYAYIGMGIDTDKMQDR